MKWRVLQNNFIENPVGKIKIHLHRLVKITDE